MENDNHEQEVSQDKTDSLPDKEELNSLTKTVTDAPKVESKPDVVKAASSTKDNKMDAGVKTGTIPKIPKDATKDKPDTKNVKVPDLTQKDDSSKRSRDVSPHKKPLQLGDNTIILPDTFFSTMGALSRDISADILSELTSIVTRRDDLVWSDDFNHMIRGESSLHSTRQAFRPIEVVNIFDRYHELGVNAAVDFVIRFDGSLAVSKLERSDGDQLVSGGIVDSRKITSLIRGSLNLSRTLLETLANHFFDSLVVYDMQYVFFIAQMFCFILQEVEDFPNDMNCHWNIPANDIVVGLNLNIDNAAQIQIASNTVSASFTNGHIVLLRRSYTDADINVMRMIGAGLQLVRVVRNERQHIINAMTSENLFWLLLNDGPIILPAWAVPTPAEVMSFVRKLGTDLRCQADILKGFNRATSIFHGITVRYWGWQERGGAMKGPKFDKYPQRCPAETYSQAQIDAAQREAQRHQVLLQRLEVNDASERTLRTWMEHYSMQMDANLLADRHDALNAYIGAARQVQRALNLNPPAFDSNRSRSVSHNQDPEDDDSDEYELPGGLSQTLSELAVNQAPARPPPMNFTNEDVRRRLIQLEDARGRLVLDARNSEVATAAFNRQRQERQANTRRYSIFVPCSLELGGIALPRPQCINILWRMLELVGNIKTPEWAVNDLDTFYSTPVRELTNASAYMALLLSLGTSHAFHTCNLSGSEIQLQFGNVPRNSRGIWNQLTKTRDPQTTSCIIAETATYFINECTGMTMNPTTYYIANFANNFVDFNTRQPFAAYEALSGGMIPYIVLPLSAVRVIKQFPDNWGVAAPGIKADLASDINLYNTAPQRGWFADQGCMMYKNAFSTKTPFRHVSYGTSVLNTLLQHYELHDLPQGLSVRRFVQAGKAYNQMDIVEEEWALWDDVSRCIYIGSVVTFDWTNKQTLALAVIGNTDAHRTFLARIATLPKDDLDSGYTLFKSLNTEVPGQYVDIWTDDTFFIQKGGVPHANASHSESANKQDSGGN